MPFDSARKSSPPPRILCADDEPAIRDVLCALLRREGYEAENVGNGLDAWNRLAAPGSRFDLLVTDNEMPGLTGAQLVQRAREAGLPLKILVFSASIMPGEEEIFRAWAVDAIVPKGSPIDELLRSVRQLLQAAPAHAPRRFES